MKKKKIKTLVRSARKAARKDIQLSLVNSLKETAGKLGQTSKKFEKEIVKGSKALAKKLSGKLTIDKSALEQTAEKAQVTETAEPVKPVSIRGAAPLAKPAVVRSRPATAIVQPADNNPNTAGTNGQLE